MSVQTLCKLERICGNRVNYNIGLICREFSRKAKNSEGSYVRLGSRGASKDNAKLAKLDPNFELLAATNGFPFILPGNVGMAWYDSITTAQSQHEIVMEQIENIKSHHSADIICRIQTCPTVLRKSVSDLFPYRNFESSELSVVTISLKSDMKLMRKNQELETEKLAQTFLLTAKNVCDKLKRGGYWADFINPFSGRPYLYPTSLEKLYEADEKFRCLDFQIFEVKDCKIISNEQEESIKRRFIGSLFTNAPSKKAHLNELFSGL